jgi:hypothetical protein
MNANNPNPEMTMDDASARFSLLEIDGVTPTADVPVFVAKPDMTEASPEAKAGGSRGVSAEGKARAQEDELAASEAGFSLAPPVYEIGSLVNSWGVSNFKASRVEHDAKPGREALEKLSDIVKAEDRKDHLTRVPDITMLDDGRIRRRVGTDGKGQATYGKALPITERALSGVGTHITPGGAGYLKACPSDLRAHNVNHWTREGYREDARATEKAMEEWDLGGRKGPQPAPVMVPKEVTLRTRINATAKEREVFAVVGPRYGKHDIDDIAAQIMESKAIPADAKFDVVYDGYRARIDVLFHTDIQPEKAVAGEIFKAGLLIKTADDGSGSIQISAQVWRNLCLNLIIIDHAKDLVTRRKHFGSGIEADVEAGIATAMGKVKHFADKWSEATMEKVLEKYGVHDVEAVFRGLVFNKVVHVSGVKPEDMFERLMRAYQAEPGYGKDAIVNAVTRAAHTEEWSRWTDVEDMERTGGALLFQPVWNIKIPEGTELSY